MEEFIKMRGKILKIENPIAMFSSILGATSELQVNIQVILFLHLLLSPVEVTTMADT
jgi:hypothetical protein